MGFWKLLFRRNTDWNGQRTHSACLIVEDSATQMRLSQRKFDPTMSLNSCLPSFFEILRRYNRAALASCVELL